MGGWNLFSIREYFSLRITLRVLYRQWKISKLKRDGKTTLPTWDNVGACRWLLCKWSSILAINGAAAVMNPNLIPLLTTLEKESNLITLPSVSRDKNDFGSTYASGQWISTFYQKLVSAQIVHAVISASRTWNNIWYD